MRIRITRAPLHASVLVLGCGMLLSGCTEHASEVDKAAAAQAAATRQQQADDAAAARKGIEAAEGQLAQLPPPAKARYLQVHTADAWSNPFLIVGRRTVTLRMVLPGNGASPPTALPNGVLPEQKLHAFGPKKQEVSLRLIDLPEALASLPEQSWEYGRVVAVQEDPATPKRERPQMRRNLEAVMAMLNDLDVVVNEWPSNGR